MRASLISVVIWILLGSASFAAYARDLPKGWRLPSPDELSDIARKDFPDRYAKAVGDFNSEGIVDEALLLKRFGCGSRISQKASSG